MIRFCHEIDEDSESFLQKAQAENFKMFLQWTLDCYSRVWASKSLNNYWQVLNMHILNQTGCALNNSIKKDVINVRDCALAQ